MKKAIIFGLTLATALTLAGCSTSNEEAIIDRLSHQLDRTTNAVNLVANDNANELTLDGVSKLFNDKATQTELTTLSNAYQTSAKSASDTSTSFTKIHRKIKNIKKMIAGGVKLGNENASAINDLTTSMQKYTNNLNKTKSDYKNTAKNISKLNDSNSSELDAKLTRLSCCVEARNCYMQNLLLTLENIENILHSLEESDEQSPDNLTQNETNFENIANNYVNETPINQNTSNASPINYPANNYYNNGANGFNNFSGANGFGYGYNGNWCGGFNPDRNTDTYGPGVTNIDTYKFYGNNRRFQGSNGINMIEAEQSPENVEEELTVQPPILEENELTQNSANENYENLKENESATLSQTTTNLTTKSANIENTENAPKIKPEIKRRKNLLANENQQAQQESNINEKVNNETTLNDQEEQEELKNIDELKVRSVSTDIEKSFGQDKPKGHTQTTSADINKKIEKLIKKTVN